MKYGLLIGALFIAATAPAQNTHLSGNWLETQRMDKQGRNHSFDDTIKLNFLPGNEYTWFKKGGFIYRGTYKLENNALDMGARYFNIVQRSPSKLVLRDDEATYVFRPYTPPPNSVLAPEASAGPVPGLSSILGKWKVFKGTSDKTIKELDLSNRIKTVMIFDRPDLHGDIGYISGGKDPQGQPSWKINRFEDNMFFCNGKSVRVFDVRFRDNHLILSENGRTYFLNRFRE